MYMKAIIVLVLCVLIALCMHEYDVFTIKSAIKSLPLVDSVVVSFQVIFQWLYTLFQRYAGTVQIRTSRTSHGERIFTADELKIYTREETGLYLAILGRVYDVSEGKEFYGQKGHYRHFTGRDGSRAFVTGDFTESGLTDHVLDLPSEDLLSITSWVERYNQRYKYKGKLVGRYYDDTGTPTDYQIALEGKIKLAKEDGAAALQEKLQFPPCNVEWTQDDGTRVWCTTMSGGIKRDWVGVPRKLFKPDSDTFRCACVNMETDQLHKKGNLKEYTGCNPKATSCHVSDETNYSGSPCINKTTQAGGRPYFYSSEKAKW